MSRLEQIALDTNDPNHQTALNTIGSHLRGLFSNVNLFDDIQAMIARLREAYPRWHKAAHGINDWLYFDRNSADEAYQKKLREYYDELLPTDPLEQLHYYSSGWATDVHDPDVSYDREGDNDYHYGENKIYELIDDAPKEAVYFLPFLDMLLEKTTNSGWIAVARIARHVDDAEHLLRHLLENMKVDSEIAVISNLVRNVISCSAQADRNKGLECL